jgi:hypothetical protein
MITTILLAVLYQFLALVLSPLLLLQDVALSPDLTAGVANIVAPLNSIDVIFPVFQLLAIVAVWLTVEGGIFTYKGIMWVIKKIPGLS